MTKVFTSSNSGHTREIVAATREGGASLTSLSGLVAGNFSVFWMSLALAAVLHRFHYLKYALAILLVFIGSKPSLTRSTFRYFSVPVVSTSSWKRTKAGRA